MSVRNRQGGSTLVSAETARNVRVTSNGILRTGFKRWGRGAYFHIGHSPTA